MRKKTSPSGKKNGFEAKRPSARLGAGKRVTQPGVLAKALEGKEPSERQAMCGKARKVGAARKQESEGKAHGEAPVPVMESALSTNGQDSTAASLDPAGRMDAVSDMEADGDPGEGPSLGTNPSESKMEENMEEGGCTAKASGCEWGSRPAGGAPTTRSRFSLRSSKHGCETEHAAQQLSPRCSRAQESAGGRAAVERDCAILARRVAEQALAAADHTGYGHTVPLSNAGKTFCIIYSIIGIPLTLLLFTALVQRIMVHVTHRPISYFHLRWGYNKQTVAVVHALVIGFVAILCFFLIPAAIFSALEDDWNFLESFYFCFISLSTIGLGDYVPAEGQNQRYRQLYKFGITCYLILGLIVMLVVLETFCELQGLKKFRKMFYRKKMKEGDQLNIIEHDQLTLASISEQAASLKEEQMLDEHSVPDGPLNSD